jgi:hypothetical protein
MVVLMGVVAVDELVLDVFIGVVVAGELALLVGTLQPNKVALHIIVIRNIMSNFFIDFCLVILVFSGVISFNLDFCYNLKTKVHDLCFFVLVLDCAPRRWRKNIKHIKPTTMIAPPIITRITHLLDETPDVTVIMAEKYVK